MQAGLSGFFHRHWGVLTGLGVGSLVVALNSRECQSKVPESGRPRAAPAAKVFTEMPSGLGAVIRDELPQGDVRKGDVLFIAQLHASLWNIMNAENPMNHEGDYSKENRLVGLYQQRILQFLSGLKPPPTLVLSEGISEDKTSQDIRDAFEGVMKKEGHLKAGSGICDRFVLGTVNIEDQPTEEELPCYALFGSAHLYALMNPRITLVGPEIPEDKSAKQKLFLDANGRLLKRNTPPETLSPSEQSLYHYLYTEREDAVTRIAQEILVQNGGGAIVVIYGVEHSFCDSFKKLHYLPRLRSVGFPDLMPWDYKEYPLPCREND